MKRIYRVQEVKIGDYLILEALTDKFNVEEFKDIVMVDDISFADMEIEIVSTQGLPMGIISQEILDGDDIATYVLSKEEHPEYFL